MSVYPPPGNWNVLGPLILWIYDTRCIRCLCSGTRVVTPDGYLCDPCARGDAVQLPLFPQNL